MTAPGVAGVDANEVGTDIIADVCQIRKTGGKHKNDISGTVSWIALVI